MTNTDLVALDATEQAAKVQSGEISAKQLVEATLARIEAVDPLVNAYRVVMAEEALTEADRIDSMPDVERNQMQLAGVPVAIKDDTDVAGQSTLWGSSGTRGICSNDAEAVARLRREGAVVIGKTNVPELTLWPWTATETFGVTRNPWNLDRTPGGSSGGSAAAVSSGMAAMAIGSDGGGSVRYPAGLTGLVGLKPQRDRVPLGLEHASGWHGLVALGPLTRSVRDAALFLDVTGNETQSTRFTDALSAGRRSLRIAVSTNTPPGSQVSLSADRRQQVEAAAELLGDLGHEMTTADISYGLASLWNSTVRLLKGAQGDAASMPDRRQLEARTRSVARMGRLIPTRSLGKALRNEQRVAASINSVFDKADVVLTPLCEAPAPSIGRCPTRGANRSLRAANTSAWLVPWNLIGQPAIAVPTGLDANGMPTAVHIAGRSGDEATLLALAAQIETAQPFPAWTQVVLNIDN